MKRILDQLHSRVKGCAARLSDAFGRLSYNHQQMVLALFVISCMVALVYKATRSDDTMLIVPKGALAPFQKLPTNLDSIAADAYDFFRAMENDRALKNDTLGNSYKDAVRRKAHLLFAIDSILDQVRKH